jgi:ATP-binding cassette subfamily B protein
VILDEPFRGLDREKRVLLLKRARELWKGATLLCVTHDVSETLGFDRVIVIEDGRIAEGGSPQELRARSGSRYAAMLEAEEEVRRGMWGGPTWRRATMRRGELTVDAPDLEPTREAS